MVGVDAHHLDVDVIRIAFDGGFASLATRESIEYRHKIPGRNP
jgi:hypothetical protein